MPNNNLKLIPIPHSLQPLFPNLTPVEIDNLISLVKSGEMPPLVGRLSESQRAMMAAHLVTQVGTGGRGGTPPGEINLTTAAGYLGISVDSVQMARTILSSATSTEIARVYAGALPIAVGRDILNGLTPEQRHAKRPHDARRAPTRRPSVFAERVLARMAEDEEKRARKAETARLRREKAKAALPIVEMAKVLITAAQHIPVDDAYSALSPHVSHAQLTTLIEWLIDIAYKEPRHKEPSP